MAPIPVSVHALSSALPNYVGGNEPALSWSTLFSFGPVLFAAMQGTLAMESTNCRISYKKWKLMIALECFEILAVLGSEISSVAELNSALRTRLEWLAWLPHVLLFIGLIELALDIHFTIELGVDSRLYWTPFSIVGWPDRDFETRIEASNGSSSSESEARNEKSASENGCGRKHVSGICGSTCVELFFLSLTFAFTLLLFGWRQRWWLYAEGVDQGTALQAAQECWPLSLPVLAACMGWGILLSFVSVAYIMYSTLLEIRSERPTTFQGLFMSFNPGKHVEKRNIEVIDRSKNQGEGSHTVNELKEMQEQAYKMEYGQELIHIEESMVKRAPIHCGNSIVGHDVPTIFLQGGWRPLYFYGKYFSYHLVRLCVLLNEHLTILPFQFCIVMAVILMHNKLDEETFTALKELADSVIVLAAVELAVGLKKFLWSFSYVDKIHKNDRFSWEQIGESGDTGILQRLVTRNSRSSSESPNDTELTAVESSSYR